MISNQRSSHACVEEERQCYRKNLEPQRYLLRICDRREQAGQKLSLEVSLPLHHDVVIGPVPWQLATVAECLQQIPDLRFGHFAGPSHDALGPVTPSKACVCSAGAHVVLHLTKDWSTASRRNEVARPTA